jgi:hypothetical protein
MKKIYCGKEFNLFHSEYAFCGKAYSDNKVYQCSQCYGLQEILNNRLVKKLHVCANCDHFLKVPYNEGENYKCKLNNHYTEPVDSCHDWDIARDLI